MFDSLPRGAILARVVVLSAGLSATAAAQQAPEEEEPVEEPEARPRRADRENLLVRVTEEIEDTLQNIRFRRVRDVAPTCGPCCHGFCDEEMLYDPTDEGEAP